MELGELEKLARTGGPVKVCGVEFKLRPYASCLEWLDKAESTDNQTDERTQLAEKNQLVREYDPTADTKALDELSAIQIVEAYDTLKAVSDPFVYGRARQLSQVQKMAEELEKLPPSIREKATKRFADAIEFTNTATGSPASASSTESTPGQ